MEDRSGSALILKMAAATDTGTVRTDNQDFFYFSKKDQFFIVCDGMGGHDSGKLASKIAGETLRDVLTQRKFVDIEKICTDLQDDLPASALQLIAGVRLANRRVFNFAQQNRRFKGMGTTLVAGLVRNGWLYVVHIGDSRFYRMRDSKLNGLTTDHSWINELLEDREINEAEARRFRQKNVLTRALGTTHSIKIDLRIDAVRQKDVYLLCTDGLHHALPDELIQSVLSADHGSLQKAVDKLVNNARLLDGSDNITAGLIYVEKSPSFKRGITALTRTIPETPAKVGAYLDRILKKIYPAPGFKRKTRVPLLLAGAAILTILILALILFHNGSAQKAKDAMPPSALLQPESDIPAHPANRPVKSIQNGGILVLLQIRDSTELKALKYLDGVQILDRVQKLNNRLPLYAGTFTWALADSNNQIVHKRSHLNLRAIQNWPRQKGRLNSANAPSSTGVTIRNSLNSSHLLTRGRVFLIGNFSNYRYQKAAVYINEWNLGPLQKFLTQGFYLRPGTYTISIRDSSGFVLREKQGVEIIAGRTIPVEF